MNPARKLYLDNIRWMTVVLVVIYHVVYMYNGVQPFGVIGPFRERQLQDCLIISAHVSKTPKSEFYRTKT